MIPIELPDFYATWWPIRMETVPGSGETITVAAVVRAKSGQSQIRQTIAPAVLSGLFGPAGKGVASMVGTTVLEFQHQLDAGLPVEKVDLPFGGFHLGDERDCVARDINEVFDVAIRFSTAFGQSAFGSRAEPHDGSKKAFEDWAEKVRTGLLKLELARDTSLAKPEEFNVKVRLSSKAVRVGFLRGSYAVNFGVLRPGSTSGDSRSLKVKVFDLEAIRREQLPHIEHAEVLIGCPMQDGLSYLSNRERASFLGSLEFLMDEAKARSVKLVQFADPSEAANHIAKAIAA